MIIFPELKQLLEVLLSQLAEDSNEEIKFMGYSRIISALGHLYPDNVIQGLADEALSLIEPEILKLQGECLSPELYVLYFYKEGKKREKLMKD